MSFNILIIPEDPSQNGYILKPLFEKILADAGKPNAEIEMLKKPRVMGYSHAVSAINEMSPEKCWRWDALIFMPDSDLASDDAMRGLEAKLALKKIRLLCCPAVPEVEIYACFGSREKLGAPWNEVRASTRMKEEFFEPLLAKEGDAKRAGGGRDLLMEKSLSKMSTLYQFCPELKTLRDRIAAL